VSDNEDEPLSNRFNAVSVAIAALTAGGVIFFACYAVVLLVTS